MKYWIGTFLLTLTTFTWAEIQPKVINGVDAPEGNPVVAAIFRITESGRYGFYCGGTLIAPDWILTAAHCMVNSSTGTPYNPSILMANLNDPTIMEVGQDDVPDGIDVLISSVHIHPDYDPDSVDHDIALMKLDRLVEGINPATYSPRYIHGTETTELFGWGTTSTADIIIPDVLQTAIIPSYSNAVCNTQYNLNSGLFFPIQEGMLCAGDIEGNQRQDSCQGDSGGPLFLEGTNEVIGIVSWGLGCNIKGIPGVYTRVSHYVDWIDNIVLQDRAAEEPQTNDLLDGESEQGEAESGLAQPPGGGSFGLTILLPLFALTLLGRANRQRSV